MWIERASWWLVSFLNQFRGWNIPIQVRVCRGHLGLSWRFIGVCIFRCNLQGISWFLLVQHFLPTISSFYCIFLLMEGLRFGWDIVLFGRASPGPFLVLISLILSLIHHQKLWDRNTKGLYVKVNINEETKTNSRLYFCMP